MKFMEELIKMGACESAVEWVGDKTKEQAWNECERGDWMWWYLMRTNNVTIEQSVAFAKFCTVRAVRAASTAVAAWVVAWAASSEWAVGMAERKKQADFIRSIINFDDIKEKT